LKIAIIGGGGTRTPILVRGLLTRVKALGIEEISLMDLDPQRIYLIRKVIEALPQYGSQLLFSYEDDSRKAIEGASFVFLTIRAGGEEMRIKDERIPLALGILGQETTGPGGFAMACRTLPQALKIARETVELAKDAWLINFTNPAGIITQGLLNFSPLKRVVGICDAPVSLRKGLEGYLNEEIFLDYFGLNHCGWTKGVWVRGNNILPSILEKLKGFPRLEKLLGFPVDFIHSLGMIPNPYLKYHYFQQEAVEELMAKGATRGEVVKEENDTLFSALRAGADPLSTYLDYINKRESAITNSEFAQNRNLNEGEGYSEVALSVLEGLLGKKSVVILNSRNSSSVPFLSPQDVVELPCYLDKDLVRPLAPGEIRDDCLSMLLRVKLYERATIQGIVEDSYEQLLYALSLNPWISSYHLAKKILDRFAAEQSIFFPPMKGGLS